MRRTGLTLVAVALALLAGCAGLSGVVDHPLDRDPSEDQIGWENGYWYDEPIQVTTDDGLNESERAALLGRTMARVEHVREREFDGNVTISVISRAEYRNRSGGAGSGAVDLWNEQVWEALFLVGEDRTVGGAMGETLGTAVQGYYAPANDSIVVVSDSPTATIDRSTLAHELVHALQDQAGALNGSAPTQDRQLARQSVTEGEANLVQFLYDRRCRQGRWECIDRPERNGSGGSVADGVFVVLYQPYASGPSFVLRVRERGGWDAVDALYDDPPNSTEQVIHPEQYPDDQPADVRVPDRSNDAWSRFDHDPVADTVGEASIYAMLQDNGAIDPEDVYAYQSKPSAGWAGDSLVPYRNGSGGYGYVWQVAWESDRDAREFLGAYRDVLREHDASSPAESVYVVPESDPYADAVRVTRSGDTVTIVNAPTRDALDAVHEPTE